MPGRDITRLLNSAARVLLLLTCVIGCGTRLSAPAWSQEPAAQTQSKPDDAKQTPDKSSPTQAAQSKTDQSQTDQQKPAQETTDQPKPDQQPSEQQKKADDEGIYVLRKDVDEVMLHATVVEDGKQQNIISFHHVDIPVAMGIVIDNSGSMREKRAKVNQAALNLVRSSNPRDEVFIVNFNDEQYLDQDFTHDLRKMKEALEKIDARGGTALYDAVVASADHLRQNARLEKKVIFLVTDGEDNASSETLEQAIKQLQQEGGPSVYTLGLLGDEDHPKRARKALQIIADHTGGISFFPKTLDEVDAISRTIANDIRNQYAIGYKPTSPKKAGEFRQIRVEAKAKGHGKLVVRTKTGYYAGTESASSVSR